jgi:hypothetical protein
MSAQLPVRMLDCLHRFQGKETQVDQSRVKANGPPLSIGRQVRALAIYGDL